MPRGSGMRHIDETWVTATGFAVPVLIYLASWLGWVIPEVEMVALAGGLVSAFLKRMALSRGLGLQRRSALRFWR